MNAPIITLRNPTAPYALVTQPMAYSETVARQSGLPVLSGDNSDSFLFRIYNNYGTPPSSNIATAVDLYITTYDGASAISRTASTSPVAQMWMHFLENGFGEQSSVPGLYNVYTDEDVAVGGSQNIKVFSYGSDGSLNSYVRAGSSGSGVGFIEVKTYAAVALLQSTNIWNFGISVGYEWTT